MKDEKESKTLQLLDKCPAKLAKPIFGPQKLIKLAVVNDLLKRKDLTMKAKLIVISIIDEVIPDD